MMVDRITPEMPEDPGNGSEPPRGEEFHETSIGLKIAVVVFVLIAGVAAGYAWLQHDTAQQLAAERADLRASLTQEKAQDDALSAKVNALSAAQAQQEAARAQTQLARNESAAPSSNQQFPPRTQEATRHIRHSVSNRRAHVDDPRWKQVQGQLGDQQKQLAENQKQLADSQKQIADTQASLQQARSDLEGNLQSARTELGGDIARNHDELVTLEKKGERNYFEFNFEKSKTYHHSGPISISLRKADNKHEYCDLQMIVDDREITRKHVSLFESVTLYPDGYPLPLELVINRIDKDAVHGYVSEPKYRSTEKTAVAAVPTTSASVQSPATADSGARLEHRGEGVR